MTQVGNKKANQHWEARMPANKRITPGASDRAREDFIREKYERRAWFAAVVEEGEGAPTELTREQKRDLRRAAAKAAPVVTAQPEATPIVRSTSAPSLREEPHSNAQQPFSPQPQKHGGKAAEAAALFGVPQVQPTPVQTTPSPSPAKTVGLRNAGESRVTHRSSPWVPVPTETVSLTQPSVLTPPVPVQQPQLVSQPIASQPVASQTQSSASSMFEGLSLGTTTMPPPAPRPVVKSNVVDLLDFGSVMDTPTSPTQEETLDPLASLSKSSASSIMEAFAENTLSKINTMYREAPVTAPVQPQKQAEESSSFDFLNSSSSPAEEESTGFGFINGSAQEPTQSSFGFLTASRSMELEVEQESNVLDALNAISNTQREEASSFAFLSPVKQTNNTSALSDDLFGFSPSEDAHLGLEHAQGSSFSFISS